MDTTKHIKITFVPESAVDQGGPLREYFHLLLAAIATSNTLFCGPDVSRTPNHNIVELEKMTFYYVRVIISLSLIHGGTTPHFSLQQLLIILYKEYRK